MSEIFQNILTIIGQQKKAAAEVGVAALNITHFKVGDSNGQYYTPTENQTDLVNTKYTANFVAGTQSQIIINPTALNEVLYKCFIPADVGGFTVRELGLFDANNDLILICKLPAQDKFALESGLYQPLTFTPKIIYTNPATQAVLTPSSQIIATQTFVTQQITQISEQVNEDLSEHIIDPNAHQSLFAEKAALSGSSDQVFSVADALLNNQAVNLGQLNKLKYNFVPYSVNSGNVDAGGYPDLINKISNTEISFKVGGSYPNMGITFPNGNHYVISSIANINSGLTADGTYTFVIEEGNLTKLSDGTYSATGTAVKIGYSYDGNNVIPVMTSDSSGGWTTSASSHRDYGAEFYPWKACDGISGDVSGAHCFMSASYSGWWKILKNSGTFTTKKIGICCSTPQYGMRDFTIRDQDNNVLVTVTDAIWNIGVFNNYELPAELTGTGIILNVTASYNGYTFLLDEVVIYEHLVSVGGNITEGNTYPETTDVSIVPVMTANSSGGWTATASSNNGYNPFNAFDGVINATGGWQASIATGWLNIAKDSGTFNCSRVAVSSNDQYDMAPKDFTIKDNLGNVLKTLTNQVFSAQETKYYDISATGISAIKIDVTLNNGNGGLKIAEVKLYTTVTSVNGDLHSLINQIPILPQLRTGGVWIEKQFTKLGQITKTSGVIGLPLITYAFNGYSVITQAPPNNYMTQILFNHNIGSDADCTMELICTSAELGYVVGDKALPIMKDSTNNFEHSKPYLVNKNQGACFSSSSGGSQYPFIVINTAFGNSGITYTKWNLVFKSRRSF